MSNDPTKTPAPERRLVAPERTVMRSRGCWNCIHWENGDLAKAHYKSRRQVEVDRLKADQAPVMDRLSDMEFSGADKAANMLKRKMGTKAANKVLNELRSTLSPEALEEMDTVMESVVKEDARFKMFDDMINSGSIGVCMKSASQTDFVHNLYLCDQWTGKEGSSLATQGAPLDKLPDELKDIVDSKAKPR